MKPAIRLDAAPVKPRHQTIGSDGGFLVCTAQDPAAAHKVIGFRLRIEKGTAAEHVALAEREGREAMALEAQCSPDEVCVRWGRE